MLNDDKLKLLFSYTSDDITKRLIEEKFVDTDKEKAYFSVYDEFILPKGKLGNSSQIKTTVGRYIVNLILFQPEMFKFIEYINKPFDKSVLKKMLSTLTRSLMNEEITPQQMSYMIDKVNWIGFSLASYFCPNVSIRSIKPLKSVIKKRDELIKTYADGIKKKDPIVITKMGKELEAMAYAELQDDSGIDIYKSGGAKNFGNTYKNLSIMRGTIKDVDRPGEYHICMDNLMDGIEKENFYKYADLSIEGSYSRGVQTAVGGYMFKQFSMAFQTLVLNRDKESDCGSKKYNEVNITEFNKNFFNDRFIIEGTKLVLLNEKNISNYIGKKVKLRSPMFCKDETICAKCSGILYHKMKIYNIGLTTSRVASVLMGLSMKLFHDTTIKTKKLDIFSKIKKV